LLKGVEFILNEFADADVMADVDEFEDEDAGDNDIGVDIFV
jgi:hypothetical protein